MIPNYIYALGGVTLVSLISFVGLLTLSFREEKLRKYIYVLISLAVGALLGDVFIHLLPEAFEDAPGITTSILIIVGIAIFFTIEKFFHWHHHGEDPELHVHPVCKMVLFSDGLHNLIDGLIIGGSFMVSIPVGIATTLAVVLHEIPQEIGDFAVLLHAGYTKARALWLNFLSALLAVAGVILAFLFENLAEPFSFVLLPMAAGGFIYLALADLIPELHKAKGWKQSALEFIAVAIGVGAMVLLTFLE